MEKLTIKYIFLDSLNSATSLISDKNNNGVKLKIISKS